MDRNVGRKGSEPIKAEALRHLAERILNVEDEAHGFDRLGSDGCEIVRQVDSQERCLLRKQTGRFLDLTRS